MEKDVGCLCVELLEIVFGGLGGREVAVCRLVCRQWKEVVDGGSSRLPKVHWRDLTVSAQTGFQVILQRPVLDPPSQSPHSAPNRPSLKRSQVPGLLTIKDRLTQQEMPHLLNYFRHLDADKLVLQGLAAKGLMTMLLIFKRYCLKNRTLVLEMCNFEGIPVKLLDDFFDGARRGRLCEVEVRSCVGMEKVMGAEEFWAMVGGLRGPLSTVRLVNHRRCGSQQWYSALAQHLLRSVDEPPCWLLQLEGVPVEPASLHRLLVAWLHAPNPHSRLIKLVNVPGIHFASFWNSYQQLLLNQGKDGPQPSLARVLEPCFDGKFRYAYGQRRMIFKKEEAGKRFTFNISH